MCLQAFVWEAKKIVIVTHISKTGGVEVSKFEGENEDT
jgi:hypothetical protein